MKTVHARMGGEPTDTHLWLFPELGLCSFPRLLTSAVWNCWPTKFLFLHLLFWLFATCIFGLIWVTVYFNTLRPLAYFCPLLFCPLLFCSSPSLLRGDTRETQFQIWLLMRTFLQTRSYCAVMSRLSSTAERGCSFQLLHQCFGSWRLFIAAVYALSQVTHSLLVTVLCITQLPPLTNGQQNWCSLLNIWRFTIFFTHFHSPWDAPWSQ